MIAGDPQFCLRDKPAKRKALKAGELGRLFDGQIITCGPSGMAEALPGRMVGMIWMVSRWNQSVK